MSKVAIVTDSNSGITQSEAKEYCVTVMPMPFFINDQTYYEDIDLTQEDFYQKLSEDANISTSMPLVGNVTDTWDELLQEMCIRDRIWLKTESLIRSRLQEVHYRTQHL